MLDALERRAATGFMAWHSVASFHYLVVSTQGASATKAFLVELLRFVTRRLERDPLCPRRQLDARLEK